MGGLTDTPAGRRKYVEYLAWLAEDEPARKGLNFEPMSRGWVIGGKGFKQEVVAEHQSAASALDAWRQAPSAKCKAGHRSDPLKPSCIEI